MSVQNLEDLRRRTLELVRQIPAGRVMTYGQIAALVGFPGYARHVGHVLRGLPQAALEDAEAVPWQRVVSASGQISTYKVGSGELQQALLEAEGVSAPHGRVTLKRHLWHPEKDL